MGAISRIAASIISGASAVRPDRKLVAGWLYKMEPAATGEGEDRLADAGPVRRDQRKAGVKVIAVEDYHRAAFTGAASQISAVNPALQTGAVKGDIVRTIPFKAPAEDSAKEITACLRVCRGKLDIVDLVVLRFENVMHGGIIRIWLLAACHHQIGGNHRGNTIHIRGSSHVRQFTFAAVHICEGG